MDWSYNIGIAALTGVAMAFVYGMGELLKWGFGV